MHSNPDYRIQAIDDGVWAIEMPMVRAFIAAGTTSALLIDSGAGGVNLHEAVRSVTDLPVRIVNTHSHFDHISGNGYFDLQFAHPMEVSSLAKAGFNAQPVNEGSAFDLGGRMLQVVDLPGHSPGSIGLWDTERGYIFAGDVVAQDRPVFLALDGGSLEAFVRSMERLLSMRKMEDGSRLERIFCAHGALECNLDTIEALLALANDYTEGRIEKLPLPEQYASVMNDGAGFVRAGKVSLLVN